MRDHTMGDQIPGGSCFWVGISGLGFRSDHGMRVQGSGFRVSESGPLRAVHLSRHKWPGGLVNCCPLRVVARRVWCVGVRGWACLVVCRGSGFGFGVSGSGLDHAMRPMEKKGAHTTRIPTTRYRCCRTRVWVLGFGV